MPSIYYVGDGRGRVPARMGKLGSLHGRSVDARRHGPGLCRDDGA